MKKVFLSLLAITIFAVPAMVKAADGIGVFGQAGFGFANNLQLVDRLNANENWQKAALSNPQVEEEDPVFYGSLGLEGRYYSGNLVYGLGYYYHNVANGRHVVTGQLAGQTITYRNTSDLQMNGFSGNLWYNVKLDSGNYMLLGGGLAWYMASLNERVAYTVNGGSETVVYDRTAKKNTIGWHMGLEYNLVFGPVHVSMGALTRFAEVYGFKMDEVQNTDNKASGGITGLYLYAGAGYALF